MIILKHSFLPILQPLSNFSFRSSSACYSGSNWTDHPEFHCHIDHLDTGFPCFQISHQANSQSQFHSRFSPQKLLHSYIIWGQVLLSWKRAWTDTVSVISITFLLFSWAWTGYTSQNYLHWEIEQLKSCLLWRGIFFLKHADSSSW